MPAHLNHPNLVHTQAFHSYEGEAVWLSPPGRSNVRVRFGTGLKVSGFAPLAVEEGHEITLGMGWNSFKGKGWMILLLRVEESRHGFDGVEVAVAAVVLESLLTRVMGVMPVRRAALFQMDNGLQWRVPTETVSRARVGTSRLPVESGVEGAQVACAGSAYAYDGDHLQRRR